MIQALRHLVAAFVAVHLFAITLCALPSVGPGMSRVAWKQPTVQGEFQAWTERLNGWGLSITEPELEDRLWTFASAYEGVRAKVLAPFDPYFDYCGTWQSWKMFVAPHRFPERLEIEIDRGSGWELVYQARSSEHAWLASWLDHDRFRAALFRYAWEQFGKPRKEFATWVAKQAAPAFPDAHRVRVSFVRHRSPSPEEVRAGAPVPETRELEQVRDLDAVRRDLAGRAP